MKSKYLDSKGQSLAEYSLLIALLLAACMLILAALGISIWDIYCIVARGLGFGGSCAHYFYDDFADLDAWDIAWGDWTTDGEQMCGGPGEGRIFTEIPADDYAVTINSATLRQGNGYGVYFRVTDTPRFDGYSFQYDPGYRGGAFIFRKWVNGRELWPPFAQTRARGYDWWETPRDIKVVADGNTFTASVDGQPILTASDDTYSEGGIGLRTWDRTVACFDSISVDAVR
ncbi:MAG: hypothetical protein DRJ03_07775 [Chloroflexi bacterium]|nr:MAG: hypothetical protein B6I35_11775 [Anaerolineaceae bacterium 4572_32.2]RLC75611.1 MAG: hypothetical protein DRI81_11715 [Chloroflexota bacterium]RLC86802.1 MAG: hypothetical protein DRJ03_07775 [Chloroflexota bacterium]HEY74514.1 DUF1080 domain-containing protein [Thermoflexia bacterium]